MRAYSLSQKKFIDIPDSNSDQTISTQPTDPTTPSVPSKSSQPYQLPEISPQTISGAKTAFNLMTNPNKAYMDLAAPIQKWFVGQSQKEPDQRSFLGGIAAGVTKPFRVAAEGGYDLARTAGSAAGVLPPITGYEKPLLSSPGEAKYIVDNALNPNPIQNSAVKEAAGLASFAVPYGKAGFIGSKFIVPGAIQGGLSGLSQQNSTPTSIARDTAIGAGTGAVMQGVGKGLNALGGMLKNKGDSLTAENLNLTAAQKAKFQAQTGQDVASFLKENGLSGKNAADVEAQTQALQDQFDQAASNPNLRVSGQSIIDSLKTQAQELQGSTIPSDVAKADFLNQTAEKFQLKYGTGDLTGAEATALRKQVDAAIGEAGFNSPLISPLRAYRNTLHDSINTAATDQGITAGDQGLTNAGSLLSKFYKLSNMATPRAIAANQTMLKIGGKDAVAAVVGSLFGGPLGGGLALLGNKALSSPVGNNVVAGAATGLGNTLSQTLPPIAQTIAGQIGTRATTGAADALFNNTPSSSSPSSQSGLPPIVPTAQAATTNPIDQTQSNDLPVISGQPSQPSQPNQSTNQPDLSQQANLPQQSDYISGYSPAQLYSYWEKAKGAGQTRAATELRQMWVDETAHQTELRQIAKDQASNSKAQAISEPAAAGYENLDTLGKSLGYTDTKGNLVPGAKTDRGAWLAEEANKRLGLGGGPISASLDLIARNYMALTSKYPQPQERVDAIVKALLPDVTLSDEENMRRLATMRRQFDIFRYSKPTDATDLSGAVSAGL